MSLTIKQEEGLKIAVDRYKHHEKYTVIAGYAGVGKSYLVKYIIAALNIDQSKIKYATFTGKAAEVLRKKGNQNVCTLHKLLYEAVLTPSGYIFKPRKSIDCKIVVVDEVSMVPIDMWKLLISHPVYIICLGDPFQLPPIERDKDNHLLDHPHIFLDQIMRQAADSEIIQLSMQIREQQPIKRFEGNNVKILSKNDFIPSMLTWADQVLVATNQQRINYNKQTRDLLGKGIDPEEGDKIICLNNYWDTLSTNHDALINGTIGYLQNIYPDTIYLPAYIYNDGNSCIDVLNCNIQAGDDGSFLNIKVDQNMLVNNISSYTDKAKLALSQNRYRFKNKIAKDFSYGYAITVHKAQGSEWDKVLIMEEKFPYNKEEHARWLYTAVTRASDKVVLIR